MKNIFLVVLLIVLGIDAYAQPKLDSLRTIWENTYQVDSIRLSALKSFVYEKVYKSDNKDSTLYYCEILLNFAINKESDYYQAKAYNYRAEAYVRQNNLLKAEQSQKKALEIFQQIGSREDIANALWAIGLIHATRNKYVPAIQEYSESLDYYKAINDTVGISGLLTNIGNIYKAQGNYSKAIENYEEAIAMIEKAGSTNHQAKTNSIDIYIETGNYTKALIYLNELLSQIENGNFGAYYSYEDPKSGLNVRFGDVYAAQGNYPLAMDYYKSGLENAKKDSPSIAAIETKIGLLYLKMGTGGLAIEWCNRAFENESSINGHSDACECLYESYKLIGNSAQALTYYELFQNYQDSLQLEEIAASLQEMEFSNKMVADSLRQEEEKLKVELTHQKELRDKKQTQNIILVIGIIALLLALGLWSRMRFVRKANAQLKIERDRAEHSERAKHQFLANMSHEIRTPMNAIKGMIDILIRRKPKAEQVTYLESIKESSNSLLVIINDILDLSKIESGKIELENIPFSITEMVKNVYAIMQFKAEEKGLQLKLKIPAEIPRVIGDSMRLRQVLINLIGNAIKFTDKGIVTTKIVIENGPDNSIVNTHFTVSDTGIGIDEDKLEAVFNSFEQAYADTSRKFGGTGLGLTISRKLIQMHHGKIWVESKKGEGSQFHFTIPFKLDTGAENVEKETVDIDIENLSKQLQGIKILLVEDNAFNVVVAKEELQDAIEADVSVAENGAIAIELARNNKFEVVLMDIQMPIMNGYDATKRIRNLGGYNATVPIIAMSANVLKEEVALCFEAGMNDFIGKPFDVEILIQKIYSLTHLKT